MAGSAICSSYLNNFPLVTSGLSTLSLVFLHHPSSQSCLKLLGWRFDTEKPKHKPHTRSRQAWPQQRGGPEHRSESEADSGGLAGETNFDERRRVQQLMLALQVVDMRAVDEIVRGIKPPRKLWP
eukprot:3235786-Amphidinium_carterae.1